MECFLCNNGITALNLLKCSIFKPKVLAIAKWLTLFVACAYLFLFTDILDAFSLIENVDGSFFLLFMLFGISNRLLNAARIRQICSLFSKIHHLSLKISFRISLFSEFVSVLIPTSFSAEAIRIFKLSKCNLTLKQASLAVLIDRSIGFLTMCLITFIVFLYSDILPSKFDFIKAEFIPLLVSSVVVLTFFFSIILYYLRVFFFKWLLIFKDIFEFTQVIKILVASMFVYASAIATYYFAFNAAGVAIATAQVIIIVFLSFIAKLIPFSIVGVTAGEVILVVISEYFGVSNDLALTTVMVIILGKYIFSIIGFLIELYSDGIEIMGESLKLSVKNI
jgi:uncharacterized membrane protein YbhN (UPF0104 family)